MKYWTILIVFIPLFVLPVSAQNRQASTVAGTVVDAEDRTPLPGLTAYLRSISDTTVTSAGIANINGEFLLQVPLRGVYRLRLSHVGYETHFQNVLVDSLVNVVGTVALEPAVVDIDEILVEEVQERFRMRGDTTIFNADAYKVNPDASAEDLVE